MKKAGPVGESFEEVDDKQVQCKFIALTLSAIVVGLPQCCLTA